MADVTRAGDNAHAAATLVSPGEVGLAHGDRPCTSIYSTV